MGGKSSTTTQTSKPPEWAEPLFKEAAGIGRDLYNRGVGGNVYQGSAVAPLSDTTMAGVNRLAQAGDSWDTSATRPLYAGLGAAAMNSPFVNARTDLSAFDPASASANKITSEAQRLFGDMAEKQGPTAAEQFLTSTADGSFLKEGNPYFRQRLEGELDDTAARTRTAMSGMGRGNSAFSQQQLTDNLNTQRTAALEDDWNRERGHQITATGMIDASRNAGTQNRLAAAGQILGAQTNQANILANIGNSLTGYRAGDLDRGNNAYQTGINQGLAATTAMSDIDQRNFTNRITGANAVLDAGGILDRHSQNELNDEIAKFYGNDNAEWDKLNMLLGLAQGTAGDYGTTSARARQPVDIGSILKGTAMLAGKGAPSDVRLKERIVWAGTAPNGLSLYEFSYKGQKARWRGVMAQEIPLAMSDAVSIDPDGMMRVRYDKLGMAMERVDAVA
jgi:hypothetical protein